MFHILIVEDDEIQQNALKKLIQKTYPDSMVTAADSYETALESIDLNEYHLFILDIKLTEDTDCAAKTSTGLDLAFHIRRKIQYRFTPIIFITALPDKIYTAVNDLHCYNYIVKPYSDEDVINAIHAVLSSPFFQNACLELYDTNGIYFKLYLEDIIYIQFQSHVYLICTTKGIYRVSSYRIKKTGINIFSNLVRCHKSYYINPGYILNYDKTTKIVKLNQCKSKIPVGRAYKDILLTKMEDSDD